MFFNFSSFIEISHTKANILFRIANINLEICLLEEHVCYYLGKSFPYFWYSISHIANLQMFALQLIYTTTIFYEESESYT